MQDKFLMAIGLAKRSGHAVFGTEQVRDSAKAGKARLIIVASDVSDNTRKEILDSCAFYKVEAVCVEETMSQLSSALGKLHSVACAALTDIGFKTLVKNSLEHQEV